MAVLPPRRSRPVRRLRRSRRHRQAAIRARRVSLNQWRIRMPSQTQARTGRVVATSRHPNRNHSRSHSRNRNAHRCRSRSRRSLRSPAGRRSRSRRFRATSVVRPRRLALLELCDRHTAHHIKTGARSARLVVSAASGSRVASTVTRGEVFASSRCGAAGLVTSEPAESCRVPWNCARMCWTAGL